MSVTAGSNDEYRRTQSQIYNLQATILNSTKSAKKEPLGKNEESSSSVKVDSTAVLEFVQKYYSVQRTNLGELYYHPFRTGIINQREYQCNQLPFPYNFDDLSRSKPFLPFFNNSHINNLMKIKILYEDFIGADQNVCINSRINNNEIWGCDIYTDDSDPILVLRHSGIMADSTESHSRTPGNIDNKDNVIDPLSLLNNKDDIPYDLEVTIVILPCLQYYSGVTRFGLSSRQWGDDPNSVEQSIFPAVENDTMSATAATTNGHNAIDANSAIDDESINSHQPSPAVCCPHDGLSYSIFEINVIPRTNKGDNIQCITQDKESNIASKIGSNWFNQN